ncbi:MAG TPA: porin family protein [Chitinophagaceae bacterium]|nr:porin family protein [Chitinophagaceae bacterium]
MKKPIQLYLIAMLLTSIFSLTARAQETADRILPRVGIKGGLNYSNFFINDIDDKNALLGFNAGLFAKCPITRFIAIQPELYYTTKGSEVTYNNVFAAGAARFRLSYIEVPVLLVINLNENFNIHGGPYVSYLLDGRVSNQSSAEIFDFERNINTDNYNRMDAGVAIGAAIDIRKISIGARYNYGMTTIGKESTFAGTSYTFPNAKNSVFNIYLGLSLN